MSYNIQKLFLLFALQTICFQLYSAERQRQQTMFHNQKHNLLFKMFKYFAETDTILAFLSQHTDLIDAETIKGQTPMHEFLNRKDYYACQILLNMGCQCRGVTSKRDPFPGSTPLHALCFKRNIDPTTFSVLLQGFLQANPRLATQARADGMSPIHMLTITGRFQEAKQLIATYRVPTDSTYLHEDRAHNLINCIAQSPCDDATSTDMLQTLRTSNPQLTRRWIIKLTQKKPLFLKTVIETEPLEQTHLRIINIVAKSEDQSPQLRLWCIPEQYHNDPRFASCLSSQPARSQTTRISTSTAADATLIQGQKNEYCLCCQLDCMCCDPSITGRHSSDWTIARQRNAQAECLCCALQCMCCNPQVQSGPHSLDWQRIRAIHAQQKSRKGINPEAAPFVPPPPYSQHVNANAEAESTAQNNMRTNRTDQPTRQTGTQEHQLRIMQGQTTTTGSTALDQPRHY